MIITLLSYTLSETATHLLFTLFIIPVGMLLAAVLITKRSKRSTERHFADEDAKYSRYFEELSEESELEDKFEL